MYRTLVVAAAVTAAALLTPRAPADEGGITPGEPFKGELTEKKGYPWPPYVDTFTEFATEVPIKLKGGQKIALSATVVGANRKVSVGLMDPSGKMIATSKRSTAVKTVQLTVDEVNATGTYKIVVLSDKIGDFTLRATGPSDAELDATKLEEEIKELKALLAKKEEQLKALKAKKKP
jgi:hypothetical protein